MHRYENKNMGFEKFDETGSGRGRPAGTDAMISIRKSGSIGINQAALDEYFEANEAAVLYMDEAENRIGIEPVADKDADEAAYALTTSKSGGTLAPKAFLRQYDLIPEVTTQYAPEWNDDEELIVLDLDAPIGTYGSPDSDDQNEEED